MGSFDRSKIAIGFVGLFGVVFVSYLLCKRYGEDSKCEDDKKKRQRSKGSSQKESHQSENQREKKGKHGTTQESADNSGEQQSSAKGSSQSSSMKQKRDQTEAKDTGSRSTSSLAAELDESKMKTADSSFYHSAEESLMKDNKSEDLREKDSANFDFNSTTGCVSKDKTLETESQSHADRYVTANDTTDGKARGSGDKHVSSASLTMNKELPSGEMKSQGSSSSVSTVSISEDSKSRPLSHRNTTSKSAANANNSNSNSHSKPVKELIASEISALLDACQNSPKSVSEDQINGLVMMLEKKDPALQQIVLDSIVRVSSFTQNLNLLIAAGCDLTLSRQVVDCCTNVLQDGFGGDCQFIPLTNALTNVSMDPKALANLETCVSALVVVLMETKAPEEIQLSVMRPLINLCAEDKFHSYFLPAVAHLYAMLDTSSDTVRVQAAKILVNLSINQSSVLPMLSAKAPDSLLDLVDKPTSPDLILRVLTMIGNLRGVIAMQKIDQSSLPPPNKAESPKTMYTALCGEVKAPLLKSKVYRLTRHTDSDIRLKASKLYNLMSMARK